MEFTSLVQTRRSLRSLAPFAVTEELVRDLAFNAGKAPSCFNKQPWRFVFVFEEKALAALKGALSSPGNDWAKKASLIVAVATKNDLDCRMPGREYALFDTGMAVMQLILRAVDQGLIAHAIAGYDEKKAKDVIGVPADWTMITLIIIGKKTDGINPELSEKQKEAERVPSSRLPFEKFACLNQFRTE
jgi:nitroreductase